MVKRVVFAVFCFYFVSSANGDIVDSISAIEIPSAAITLSYSNSTDSIQEVISHCTYQNKLEETGQGTKMFDAYA